jgi:photosystem II stability/assembly factor-like uncharacterized protein
VSSRPTAAILLCLLTALAGCTAVPPAAEGPSPSGSAAASTNPSATQEPMPLQGAILPQLEKLADLPGGHVSAIQFAPSRPDVVYLASDANAMGIWRSSDAGRTWARVLWDEKYPNAHQTGLAISAKDDADVVSADIHGKIWHTLDGGASWQIVHDNHETTSYWAVARSPSEPGRVYVAGQDGAVMVSVDGGASWVARPGPAGESFGSLVIHPANPSSLIAGGSRGIYRSEDGAATWTKLYPAPGAGFPQVVEVAMAPERPERLLATTDAGVWRTDDAGTTWRQTLKAHAHGVAFAPSDMDDAYLSTVDGLYRSSDGGTAWTRQDAGLPKTDGRVAVHPTDPDQALVGNNVWQWQFHHDVVPRSTTGEGVYRTSDGGSSWTRSSQGFIDVDVNSVAVDPVDPRIAYVGTECSRGLYRTMDGGASWALVPGGPEKDLWDIAHYTMKIEVDPSSRLLMTGRFGFAASDDHGSSWSSTLGRRHFHALGVDPKDAKHILIGTSYAADGTNDPTYYPGNHILHSRDGGRTWSDASIGIPSLPATTFQSFAFDPSDPQTIFVATSPHDILEGDEPEVGYGVLRSRDGGATWSLTNEGLANLNVQQLVAIPGAPAKILAGTDQGIFASTDAGDHWQRLGGSMPVRSLVVDPKQPERLFLGTDEGLFQSLDGGATWGRLDSVPADRVLGLAMDPAGRVLYAAVNNHGVYRGLASSD